MEESVSRFIILDFKLVFFKELAYSLFEEIKVDVSVCPHSLHKHSIEYWIMHMNAGRRIIVFRFLSAYGIVNRSMQSRLKKAFMEEKQAPLSYGHTLVVIMYDPVFSPIGLHSFRRLIEFWSKQVAKGYCAWDEGHYCFNMCVDVFNCPISLLYSILL